MGYWNTRASMNVHGLTISCLLLLGYASLGQGTVCKTGCDLENGFCDRNGECRCRPGWQGAECKQCVPFPGCVHGTCQKAWQCVCKQGWAGSQCDQDIHLCSSQPCSGNSTCIEMGQGGYACICPPGYTGKNCQLKKGPCPINSSPCQNGGTCMDNNGSDNHISCLCPSAFTGGYCETEVEKCEPNPCLNGGTCTDGGLAYKCICPPAFSGPICNTSLPSCPKNTCGNGGTCLNTTNGGTHCICPPGLTGPLCHLHIHRLKANARPKHPGLDSSSLHYSLPDQAFHKLLKPPEHDLPKITSKEAVHTSSSLVTRSQIICFALLGLLTCLVVLGTTGIIYFNRCEMWLANVKYSQLVQQQRDCLLKASNGEDHSVNIILPEKIKLTNYGKHYTSL
ncbi:protein delta homolog 1 [Hoplias malabaricus]|uniref:protein delta homolog 1 n=1 Tax=Hoplias malabaricus TaxID=27720 RepID=UPI003462F43B